MPLYMIHTCLLSVNRIFELSTDHIIYQGPAQDLSSGAMTVEPKIEAEGQERGWDSWGGGSKPPSHQLGGLGSGSTVSSHSRVRGRAPTAQRFSTIFSTEGDLSWHYNIVNCGLSRSHWGPRPSAPRTPL